MFKVRKEQIYTIPKYGILNNSQNNQNVLFVVHYLLPPIIDIRIRNCKYSKILVTSDHTNNNNNKINNYNKMQSSSYLNCAQKYIYINTKQTILTINWRWKLLYGTYTLFIITVYNARCLLTFKF